MNSDNEHLLTKVFSITLKKAKKSVDEIYKVIPSITET